MILIQMYIALLFNVLFTRMHEMRFVIVPEVRLTPVARALRLLCVSPLLLVAQPSLADSSQTPAASSAVGTLPIVNVTANAQADQSVTQGSGSYTANSASTSTKLPLPLRETPQSVTAVTREKMDDFNQTNINQVLDSTVGVNVERIETDRTYYTSRGFDITNFQVDGQGMPMPNGNVPGDIDTAIYDHIEVVRGANGLMTGAGNPSATVNMVRKRPTRDFQAEVKGSGGSWQNGRAEADISGSMVDSGKMRGRVLVAKQQGDSYLDRYSSDKTTLYGITETDLTSSTLLTVGYSLQRSNSDGVMWGALPMYYTDGSQTSFPVSTSTAADWSYWNVENQNLFVELQQQLAQGWQAKASYNFIKTKQDAELFYMYGTPDKTTGLGLLSYPGSYQMNMNQHVVDLSANGGFDLLGRRHTLVVGTNLSRADIDEYSGYGTIGSALPPLQDWDGHYPKEDLDQYPNGSTWRDTQNAAYVAANFRVMRALSWIAGTRYVSWESNGTSYGTARNASVTGQWVPYTGLVYDLTDSLSAYTSYTSIFAPQQGVDINRDRLKPVTGDSYETGLKGEFYEGRLNTTLALFRTVQDNLAQVGGTLPNSADNYYVTQDGVQSKGYELEASGQILPGWQLAGGYTRLMIQDADGNDTRTFTPRQQIKLATTYQIQKWKVGANLRWQDGIYRTNGAGTQTRQGAYALVDLMGRYDVTPKFYTMLNVYNVGNQKYLNSLYWDQAYYGAPRSFTLTAGYKF